MASRLTHMRIRSVIAPVVLLLAHCAIACGQALPVTEAAVAVNSGNVNGIGPSGIVPEQGGYNFSLISSSQHDSGAGWSSILTPVAAFRFNRHLSFDFAAPAYIYFLANVNTGTAANPVYTLEAKHFVMGDSTLAGHVGLDGDIVSYSLTAATGMPTGNDTYGLTAGQFTYSLNNHFDLSVGRFSPDIELGLSDTSTLVNQRVSRSRSFSTTGKLAHFQAGTSVDLPKRCSFEADFYEDLPIGSQLVFGSTKGKGGVIGRGKRAGNGNGAASSKTTTATSSGAAEDNGINLSFDVPVNPHIVFSGLYSYSIRQQDRTAGFSLTYLLRARPTPVR